MHARNATSESKASEASKPSKTSASVSRHASYYRGASFRVMDRTGGMGHTPQTTRSPPAAVLKQTGESHRVGGEFSGCVIHNVYIIHTSGDGNNW